MAQAVGDIVNGTYDSSQLSARDATQCFRQYADIISPWAETVATRMLNGVTHQEEKQWRTLSRDISSGLRHQMQNTAIGQVARSIIEENIQWMKSLPLHAADIQFRAIEAMIHGERSTALMDAILRTTEVAKSRARLIARTEIVRATQALT